MDLDSALLAGWHRCMLHQTGPHSPAAVTRQAHQQIAEQEVTIRDPIRGLWRLRRSHRDMEGATGEGNAGPGVSQVWRAWSIAAKLQSCNRVLKKECRRRKTLRVVEAVQAGNIYRAVAEQRSGLHPNRPRNDYSFDPLKATFRPMRQSISKFGSTTNNCSRECPPHLPAYRRTSSLMRRRLAAP